MKKLSYLSMISVYGIILTLLSFRFVSALFTDSANSTDNAFTAAAEFPTATPTLTPTITETPIATGSVVLNEIMWMGSASASTDEWLELRNTTSNPIDLSGWKLEGAATGSTVIAILSGSIPANGFFIISNFEASSSILNVPSDFVTTTIQLDNTGLQITLRNPSNTLIDRADDGAGAPFKGDNGSIKKSMERNATPGDGTVSTNWHTATTQVNLDPGATELATPKAANSL